MKQNQYPASQIQDGDLLFGSRNGESLNLSGLSLTGVESEYSVVLGQNDIQHLGTDGFNVLPVLASDLYYDVRTVIFEFQPGNTPYVNTDILYTDGCFGCFIPPSFITGSENKVVVARNSNSAIQNGVSLQAIQSATSGVFKGLIFYALDGNNPYGGNGEMKITVRYLIREFGV